MSISDTKKSFFSITNRQARQLLGIVPLSLIGGLASILSGWDDRNNFFSYVKNAYFFYTLVFPWIAIFVGLGILLLSLKNPLWRSVRITAAAAIFLGLLCFMARIYATHIEPYSLEIKEYTIYSAKITIPLRILHITDIQSPQVGRYEEKVFSLIKELNPDIIFNTGDNLQPLSPATLASEAPKLAKLFSSLSPRYGKYCIQGNVWDRQLFQIPGVLGGQIFLYNQTEHITMAGTHFAILGLSYYKCLDSEKYLQDWSNERNPDTFNIVLGHNPEFVKFCNNGKIDLCLAGHIHGGQITLPGLGPLVTFCSLPRTMASGFYQFGSANINVSKGVGCEHHLGLPSIRVLCPPDITVLTLLPENGFNLAENQTESRWR